MSACIARPTGRSAIARRPLAAALLVALALPGLAFAQTAKEKELEARVAQLEAMVKQLMTQQQQQQSQITEVKTAQSAAPAAPAAAVAAAPAGAQESLSLTLLVSFSFLGVSGFDMATVAASNICDILFCWA